MAATLLGAVERRLVLTLSVLASAGCVTTRQPGPPSRPIVQFPGPEALATIEARPPAVARLDAGPVPAAGWTIDAALAASSPVEPWTPRTAVELAFADAATRAERAPTYRRALTCVAQQVGRYLLEQRAVPPPALRDFIEAACGSAANSVGFGSLAGDAQSKVTDDALASASKASFRDLARQMPTGAVEAGFALVRDKRRMVAIATWAVPQVAFESFSLVTDDAGVATITGSVKGPIEHLGGDVNRGRFGVQPCAADVRPPRFRVVCTLAPGDDSARVDLSLRRPQRALAEGVARLLLRRSSATSLSYRPEPLGDAAAGGEADFAQRVLDGVNAVRASASLAPVRLSVAESATAAKVAPHYFAAVDQPGGETLMDTVALGLLAGWEVTSGLIRDGRMIWYRVPQTRDAREWIAATLATPTGRAVLLADGIDEVAVGPVPLSEPDGLGAVVVSYRFHRGPDHSADVDQLRQHIAIARRDRSLPPPKLLSGVSRFMSEELARVQAGQQQPYDAMQEVLARASRAFNFPMRALVFETTDLEQLGLLDDIINQPRLEFDVGVTHHKPPGAAWGQLVIIVVFADHGGRSA